MVGYDAQSNVVGFALAIGFTGKLGRSIQNRANLVDFIQVLYTLHQKCDAFKTHTRVDVLLR